MVKTIFDFITVAQCLLLVLYKLNMPLYHTYTLFRSFVMFPWNNETKSEFAEIRQN